MFPNSETTNKLHFWRMRQLSFMISFHLKGAPDQMEVQVVARRLALLCGETGED